MSGKSVYVSHAEKIIHQTVECSVIPDIPIENIPEDLLLKRACFVSIHKKDDSLRGCIGTIEPVCDNLHQEIIRNAIASCTRDSRFDPVSEDELKDLVITVDVLSLPEIVDDISKLNPKKYGIIISDGSYRRGVLLPDLPSVRTVEEQVDIVKHKAGIISNGVEGLIISRFTSQRFY